MGEEVVVQQLQLFVVCRTGEAVLSYYSYQRTDYWRSLSQSLRDSVGRCEKCGAEGGLVVHHDTYERIGAERRKDLRVLCFECHKDVHFRTKGPRLRSPFAPERARHWRSVNENLHAERLAMSPQKGPDRRLKKYRKRKKKKC